MLARSFMTAEDLRISEHTRDVLIRLLGMLERGELRHVTLDTEKGENLFNMDVWGECGTPQCLGGWCRTLGAETTSNSLQNLFYPNSETRNSWIDYEKITVPQAATALRNFLVTGAPRWLEVVQCA